MQFEFEIVMGDGFYWAVVYARDEKCVMRYYLRRRADNEDMANQIGEEAVRVLTEKREAGERQ